MLISSYLIEELVSFCLFLIPKACFGRNVIFFRILSAISSLEFDRLHFWEGCGRDGSYHKSVDSVYHNNIDCPYLSF